MHASLSALGTIFQASPVLCTCEPRRPCGEMQAVPCGARSDTRLFPASGSQARFAQIRSVRTYNTRIYLYFELKTVLTFLGYIELFRKKRSTGSSRRFCSCLDERGPARWENAGFPLSSPIPTYPRRDPGPKQPTPANPLLIGCEKKSTCSRFLFFTRAVAGERRRANERTTAGEQASGRRRAIDDGGQRPSERRRRRRASNSGRATAGERRRVSDSGRSTTAAQGRPGEGGGA